MPSERLQKVLARAGLGSRRSCEELIEKGHVTVNGQIAFLGIKADPSTDRIEVNGKLIEGSEGLKYIAVNKPRNVISAISPQDNRKTVRDLVGLPGRLYPVGRLDVDSEGLILLTNDGELTNRLTHPKYGHEKEYRVLIARRPDADQLTTWQRGVVLSDGYRTQPAKVEVTGYHGKGAWLKIIMREGRKRQIRETGSQLGLPVVRILRVRIGTLKLGSLKPGQWRQLSSDEIAELKNLSKHILENHQKKHR
ncbi:MAG: rRNA pseudouridine synthase [Anaerolineales bacterium]|nr:MAG: rRNA pseudouridine synthase [Anaerolineales bacterium]